MKLALGTVQFGMPYGLTNVSGQVPRALVGELLRRASTAGMDTLDTAIAYGESEAVLGAAGVQHWRVVTKLPALGANGSDSERWVERQVRCSLERLGLQQLEAVLVHQSADLCGAYGAAYRRALEKIRDAGLTRAIGVSIYAPSELEQLSQWRFDLVQAPYSVLDRRLLHSGWLIRLHEQGVRIHARSIFLQGLLLAHSLPQREWFDRWDPLLQRWLAWCRDCGVTPVQAAVGFVVAQAGIERVVVGVDSLGQLEEVLAAAAVPIPALPADLYSNDIDLLEPRRWRVA